MKDLRSEISRLAALLERFAGELRAVPVDEIGLVSCEAAAHAAALADARATVERIHARFRVGSLNQ